MLIFVTIGEILHEAMGLYALFSTNDDQIWIAILANLCLNGPMILFLLKLLGFHVYLASINMTTY